ncbi:transglutaminase domain-containing protein [Methanobacterium sp.]|uniref:transglutaminase domain-containing protein n=1 Tax=Methanobacterium sp. TaxID=2164 RepID=UPI003C77DBAA
MYGGGIINRKFLSIMLLLLTIALPLNVDAISAAATNQTSDNQTSDQAAVTQEQNSAQILIISKNNTTSSETNNITSTLISNQNYAAAGTVKTTTPVTFTIKNINTVATKLAIYIKANHKLPNYILVSGKNITLSQFLYILTVDIIKVNSNSKTAITLKNVKTPVLSVTETFTNGNIQKTEYITLAKNVYNYINSYGTAPIIAKSSRGLIRYESLIYSFSKILGYYNTNNRLPAYVSIQRGIVKTPTINTSSSSSNQTKVVIPAAIQQYLDPTNNCQSNSTVIKSYASSITQGLTTQMDKAVAIFNWVRDNIGYSFYYNTKYGALGTLTSKTANCVDTSHLMIALMRAAGIPAEYEHVYAQFTSGTWYGHVIALVYINGIWYKADGTSSRNQFGVVNNWNTTTATVYGTYKELPF